METARESSLAFLSYARSDGSKYANQLATDLSHAGYEVWWDQRNLNFFADFTSELESAIASADVMIACITSGSTRQDSFVRREIGYALAIHKPIIPIILGNALPPISIINLTRVQFHGREWHSAFADLLAHIRRGLKPSPISTDPFHHYLESVYQGIVVFLEQTVRQHIHLHSVSSPESVADQTSIHPFGHEMIRQLFIGHGIPNAKPSEEFSSFAEAVERFGGRVLLLGEPGSGKTITLMSYARDAVAARIQNATQPLPILGLLSTWDPAKPLSEWLATGYTGLAATDVARVIELGQALILLDGLDEVRAPKGPSQLRERQIQLLAQLPAIDSTIITSRSEEYRQVGVLAPLEGAVTLQPMTDEQLRLYLASVPALLAALHANPDLKALVSTPLMLSLIATTCENMNASERSELMTLTSAPGDLRDFIIERYVCTRYEWEERRATRKNQELFFSSQETLTWLGRLAMENAGTYRKKASEWGWDRGSPIDANVLTIGDFQFVLGDSAKAEAFCNFARSLDVIVEHVEGSLSFRHLLVRDALAYPYSLKNLYVQDFFGRLIEVANPAHALAVTGRTRAVDTLIKLLADTDQPSIMRECAVDGLGFTRDVRCVDVLLQNLERGEFLFRSGIALGLLEDPRAFDPLISLLEHSGKSGKRGAAHGLGALGDPRAVPYLAAALDELDDDAFTAQDIIVALVRVGEPGIKVVLQKIREGLNGWESNGISASGTRVLAERGDRRALELLLSSASDTDPTVRAYVAECLGESGFPAEAAPVLQRLLSDSALVPHQERHVSDFAQEALKYLKEIKEH